MSSSGFTETAPNGDRFLVLEQGRRYEGTPGDADFRVMEFDRYATRIETKEGDEPQPTHKSLSTLGADREPDAARTWASCCGASASRSRR